MGIDVCIQTRSGLLFNPQQRFYAAEAAVAVKEPDWDQLSSLITSDEAKRELAGLRAQFGELRSKLTGVSRVRALPSDMRKHNFCFGSQSYGCFSLEWKLNFGTLDTQKPKEVKWEDFKDVDPQVLETFKKAFAGACTGLCVCGFLWSCIKTHNWHVRVPHFP